MIFEYCCEDCGIIEIEKGMKDPAPLRCPLCKALGLQRVFSAAIIPSTDSQWKDKWIPQLGPQYLDAKTKTTKNPAAHFNSLSEVRECAKKRGQDIEL